MTDMSPAAPDAPLPGGPAAPIGDVLEIILAQYSQLVKEAAIKQAAWQQLMMANSDLRNQLAVKDQQIQALQQQIALIEAAPESVGESSNGEVTHASSGTAGS